MTNVWPLVPLNKVVTLIQRPEAPVPGKLYRQIGVRLWGEGAYERELLDGGGTRYRTLSRVEANDIVVNKIWARNGSVAVVPQNLAGAYVSTEFPTFAPNLESLEPRWIHWLTKTKGFWTQCDEKSYGTSGKNRIRPEQFLTVEIPFPPLDEQRRIVARIEALAAKIEEGRGLRRQAVEEAEALTSSYLSSLVTELREKFEIVLLADLLIEAGYGTSVKCHASREDNAIPVLRIPNILLERVTLTDLKFGQLSRTESEKVTLNEGDILVVRTNGSADLVGRCAVVPELPESTAFASYLIRLRCDSAVIDPHFLQLILRQQRTSGHLIDFARTTAGQYNVSLGRLRGAEIPVPPIPEQRRIVAYLDDLQARVDALKQLQAQTQLELDALLPSVLDKAFKGEL